VAAFDQLRARFSPRREPHLARRFLVATALGLAIAGIGIFAIVDRTLARQTERQSVERARVTTRLLLDGRLRGPDLTTSVSRARRKELAGLFARANLGKWSLGGTLYGSRAVVVSTASPLLRTPSAPLVEQARRGQVTSTVASQTGGPVLRTVLPIRLGAGQVAVVELDQDYGAMAASARHAALLAAAILESLLVLLCVVLLPGLWKASQRLRRHIEQLDWLASHDELTGLLNRRGFHGRLDRTLSSSNPRGVLLAVDIDHFHEINETIGAEQGDVLLVEVGARLAAAFPSQAVARLGEDEFAVLLPGTASASASRSGSVQCGTPSMATTRRRSFVTRASP
jgi:GGDEF domain-containing protein